MDYISIKVALKIRSELLYLFIFIGGINFVHGQSRSYALIIGMDDYNVDAYQRSYDAQGTSGVKKDVSVIKSMLPKSTNIKELRSKGATQNEILKHIKEIGKKVKPGDQFLFYFSGHGDTIPDKNGDERSKFDQVLIAYDKYVVDDDIYALLKKYFTKTKNVMIVDACHSGSSYKIATFFLDFTKFANKQRAFANEEKAVKVEKLNFNCQFTEKIDEPFDLIYFGATPDDKLAGGGADGGVLTYWLGVIFRDAIDDGIWQNYTYRKLACELKNKMMLKPQTLQYHEIGLAAKNYGESIPLKSN